MKHGHGKSGDEELLRQAQVALDESIAGLDLKTQARLLQIRRQALEQRGASVTRPRPWLRVGKVAAVAVLTGLALLVFWPQAEKQAEIAGVASLEMVAAGDNIDFVEDLDFVRWLDQQQVDGKGTGA